MRIKNSSSYATAEIEPLLKFAARGIKDSGVEVHIQDTRAGSYSGWAANHIPDSVDCAATSRYVVMLRFGEWTGQMKRINPQATVRRRYPDGVKFETWQDMVVYVAAHEFRHIWQYQRTERTGKRGKREADAEKFAVRRLNEWREETGRVPLPETKEPAKKVRNPDGLDTLRGMLTFRA